MSRYVADISRYKLLTADDEVRIGKEIEASEYASWSAILQYPPVVVVMRRLITDVINGMTPSDKIFEAKATSGGDDVKGASHKQIAKETLRLLSELIPDNKALSGQNLQHCKLNNLCEYLTNVKAELREQWVTMLRKSYNQAARYRRCISAKLEKDAFLGQYQVDELIQYLEVPEPQSDDSHFFIDAIDGLTPETKRYLLRLRSKYSCLQYKTGVSVGKLNHIYRQQLFAEKRGSKAKKALTEANLRLVLPIAKRYSKYGVAYLDLVQEGNLGLIKAVERFDYRHGCKFSTYATWWIRQSITRAIANQSRTVRYPVHLNETLHKFNQMMSKITQQLGRKPSAQEISRHTGLDLSYVLFMLEVNGGEVSLNAPLSTDQDGSFVDMLQDSMKDAPFHLVLAEELRSEVEAALDLLTEREACILKIRFGIGVEEKLTLQEIGNTFGVTRERIRQIEKKALQKLREMNDIEPLLECVELNVEND